MHYTQTADLVIFTEVILNAKLVQCCIKGLRRSFEVIIEIKILKFAKWWPHPAI